MLNPNISWFQCYRPDTINDIVFSSESDKNLATSWIQNERIPGNLLLSGPAGTGKSTLARVLIKGLIKSQADLCRMKSRKVEEIDDKITPFVGKKPAFSKAKIVYIEEIDGISRAGIRQLKEDLMENYQEYVSFVCCTNFPKRVDPAVISRFTFHIEFKSENVAGIKNRLEYILNTEKSKYNPEELSKFVEENYKVGFRNLINALQISHIANNGIINFQDLEKNVNIEDNLISIIYTMTEAMMKTIEPSSRKMCLVAPLNSIIAKEYQEFVTLCHNNYDISYESVFQRLYETTRYLPLQVIIGKYSEELDMKKYPHIHLIGCFYEMQRCIIEAIM